MNPSLRALGVPILAGLVLHVALYTFNWYLALWVLPPEAADYSGHWFLGVSSWLHIALALAPGMLCGFLTIRRPLLCGALAAFLGAVIVGVTFESWWSLPIPPYLVGLQLLKGLQAAPFGFAAAGAGFLLRRQRHAL
jgi:hypothetical protein